MSTTDERTLVEKLIAMATQDASPEERDTARRMLEARGQWPPPPRPPAPPGLAMAPEPQDFGDGIIIVNWGTYQPASSNTMGDGVTTSGAQSATGTYHVTRVRGNEAWRRRFGDLGRPR